MANRLLVEFVTSTAEFQQDVQRATAAVEVSAGRMNRSAGIASAAIRGIAAAFSVGAIIAWSKETINGAERLKNFADEIGSSVENVSRLTNAVRIGGGSFEQMKGALESLSAGLAGVDGGSQKAAQALRFIGVSSKDPATALEQVAKKLDGFADGASKIALVRDIFGRANAGFIDSLKAIARAGEDSNVVTDKQAAEAVRLNEAYRRLMIGTTDVARVFLNDWVPTLANAIEDMREGTRIAGGFFAAIKLFGTLNPFDAPAEGIAKLRREIESMQKAQAKGRFADWFNELPAEIADKSKQLNFLLYKQRQEALALISPSNDDARDIRSRLKPDSGYVPSPIRARVGREPKDDASKKLLDGELRALRNYAESERGILQTREQFLDSYYGDGYLSIKQYFDQKSAAQEENTRVTVQELDAEIAALTKYRDQQGRSQRDVADTNNQIADKQAQRVKVEQDAARSSVSLWFDQQRAAADYANTVQDITARLLEMNGQSAAAAALRNKSAFGRDRKAFAAAGDSAALANLDALERQTIQQAALNDALRVYNGTLGDVAIMERGIAGFRAAGALTELEALRAVSDVRAAKLESLREELAVVEALAAATGRREDIQHATELRLEYEALAASADLVAKKFNDIGQSSFSQLLKDLASGKNALDALKDAASNLAGRITDTIADNLAQKAFGKEGIFSGFGDILGGLFGGAAGSSGLGGTAALAGSATALTGSAATLTGSATVLLTAGTALTAAAATMAASAAGSAASSIGSIFGGFSGGGFGEHFAAGGISRGGLALVGENGPELVRLNRGARVYSAPETSRMLSGSSGNNTIVQNFYVPPRANTETLRHQAKAGWRAASGSMRRG